MTRPRKQTVDYFPHSCNHGQTMFIIEQRYGNDGYAFWFKLLELLGSNEGHKLDCNKSATWNYLSAKTLVSKEKADEILNLLAELEAIDPELWKEKIIWSDNFLKGLAFAYRNRGVSIPDKPVIYIQETGICGTTKNRNPQMKVNEMKENEMKVNDIPRKPPKKSPKKIKTTIPEDFSISDQIRLWAQSKGFDRLEEHLEAFKDAAASRGYEYLDWDSAFRRAIREDWGKIRSNGSVKSTSGGCSQPGIASWLERETKKEAISDS